MAEQGMGIAYLPDFAIGGNFVKAYSSHRALDYMIAPDPSRFFS